MSDNTEFRKELEERTKQINEQIESYLPEEKGHQKTIFVGYELQCKRLVASVCVLCLCRRSADYLQEKYSL